MSAVPPSSEETNATCGVAIVGNLAEPAAEAMLTYKGFPFGREPVLNERVIELCHLIIAEEDSSKLPALIQELRKLLGEEQARINELIATRVSGDRA